MVVEFELALREIPGLLSTLLGVSPAEVEVVAQKQKASRGNSRPDLLLGVDGLQFIVEYKSSSRAEHVGSAIRGIESAPGWDDGIPLLVVPYMGDVGRRLCEEAEIPWMDLSGNAWIHRQGLHITVEGKENRFKERGRPPNLFAAKSARVVRLLLMEPDRYFWQQELADEADVHRSHVSRLVRRLVEAGFVERADDGSVAVTDPGLLLDAWSEAYDIEDHRIRRGHVAVRSPEEALSRLVEILDDGAASYAATGLAAGWLYSRHAGYRLLTIYVSGWLSGDLLDGLGWREEERGANLWLLEPNDIGVFHGSRVVEGVRCVHPVQAYLDLKCLPERASEAADVLRDDVLGW